MKLKAKPNSRIQDQKDHHGEKSMTKSLLSFRYEKIQQVATAYLLNLFLAFPVLSLKHV